MEGKGKERKGENSHKINFWLMVVLHHLSTILGLGVNFIVFTINDLMSVCLFTVTE